MASPSYGDSNGLNFIINLDDNLDLNLNDSGYMLGFFGDRGSSSPLAVGAWNGTTYMVDPADESANIQTWNLKYANETQVYIRGLTEPLALSKVPNYQSTVNVRFKNSESVRLLIARCRFYNRDKTVNDPPEGVDIKVFEVAHLGVRQIVPGFTKGDTTWQQATSGEWVDFSRSPGPSGIYGGTTATYPAKRHDWFMGISVSPRAVGSRSKLGLQFSVEYL
jgi:hypothetical protein